MKAPRTTYYSRLWLGMSLLSVAALSAQAQNSVTFQVDMSVQIANAKFDPAAQTVEVRGDLIGWGPGLTLISDAGKPYIYTNSYSYSGSAGDTHPYKFWFSGPDVWESPVSTCGNNRTVTLVGGAQTVPVVYFNDEPPVLPNNNVTFQCDMTAQVVTHAFTNGTDEIRVSGSFNGWGNGDLLTNNPALYGNASNLYSAILTIGGVPGACQSYKFRSQGGWESPAASGGNNRTFQLAGGDQVLPLVYYNDASPCDLLQANTQVTFRLQMTNGTTSADGGIVFDRGVNHLYLNGEFLGWWSWNTGFGGSEGPQYELTNNPAGSDFFQQTFTVPSGKTLNMTYKLSIDGYDNEAGFGANHVRYVRTLSGVPFTMPIDRFGTNQGPLLVESSTSNLVIGAVSGGQIPVSWGGRQCVTLQSRPTFSGGVWTDLPATEGTSSTNWPVGNGSQFFRWKKAP